MKQLFKCCDCIVILIFCFFSMVSFADETPSDDAVVIDQVPAYRWYHGCAPSAGASIVGYWDLHGYDNLFDASGWNTVKLTDNVAEQISSTAHNDYFEGADDGDSDVPPAPVRTSLADFFRTSVDPLANGQSPVGYASSAIPRYAGYRGYEFSSVNKYFGQIEWEAFKTEIDAGRPILALVNSGNPSGGSGDHFIPIIGYDENCNDNGEKCYAAYLNQSTADEAETVHWKRFQSCFSGQWGIDRVAFIWPIDPPDPDSGVSLPFIMLLLGPD